MIASSLRSEGAVSGQTPRLTPDAIRELFFAANTMHGTDEQLGKRALVAFRLKDTAAG